MLSVAGNGTVIFDHAEFNEGYIRNNLGFEHFTITNCSFNETSYLRINARTVKLHLSQERSKTVWWNAPGMARVSI